MGLFVILSSGILPSGILSHGILSSGILSGIHSKQSLSKRLSKTAYKSFKKVIDTSILLAQTCLLLLSEIAEEMEQWKLMR